jgi:selenocysteine-specific elongation factor
MIIATAGHVDHGKTSLVRALTGVNTDRLPEEKARGLTIDLGFAYVPLPDGRLIGFVDVPGHQRFLKNMLAGVGNVDHALVVVAADDGVMPQTVEHVEILDLLDVAHATVAITKTDKAAPGRCDEVEAEIRALLGTTRIEAAAFLRISTRTGDGIEALRAHLVAVAERHVATPAAGRFRMAVDRSFILHGIGVVVTGSVHAGIAGTGDAVTVAPGGLRARLRGLRIHDRDVSSVRAGDRCAANLSGIELADVRRGDWIAAGAGATTQRLDVALRMLAQRRLRHWTPAHLHIGAADLTCRIALLSEKTAKPGGYACLRLDRPIAAWSGQKFILRDQSAQRTIGGGRVLDPLPPARENRAQRPARLEALHAPDAATAFDRMLACSDRGFDLGWFSAAWNLTAPEEAALLAAQRVKLREDGDARLVLAADRWNALMGQVADVLARHHRTQPNLLGLKDDALNAAIRPPVAKALLRAAVAELREAGIVARKGAILHLSGHRVQPTPAELALWKRVEPALAAGGVRPPRVREVAAATGIGLEPLEALLARAEELGWVHRVAPNRFYLQAALDRLERIAQDLAAASSEGTFAAAEFNQACGIGRNLAIQVLEYFDRAAITQRRGDRRRLVRGSPMET